MKSQKRGDPRRLEPALGGWGDQSLTPRGCQSVKGVADLSSTLETLHLGALQGHCPDFIIIPGTNTDPYEAHCQQFKCTTVLISPVTFEGKYNLLPIYR